MPDGPFNPLITKHVQGGGGIGYTGNPLQSSYFPGFLGNESGQALKSLFGSLNQISLQGRSGSGGKGGGSEVVEGNQDANPLISLNPYMGENVTSFNRGGKMRSPYGTPKYFLGGFLRNVFGAATDVLDPVSDVVNDALDPVFDVAGNVVDPALQTASNIASTAGQAATGLSKGLIEGTLKGVRDVGQDLVIPAIKAVGEPIGDLIEKPVSMASDFIWGAVDSLFGQDNMANNPYQTANPMDNKRGVEGRMDSLSPSGLKMTGANMLSKMKESSDAPNMTEGDWVGDKPNPYVTPNVEEELSYANKGMKMPAYNQGGFYSQQANQAIAINQLSGLVNKSLEKGIPMAAYGMKNKYQEGGNYPHNMYHPETGYKIVAEDEAAHNKLNAAGFGHTPKAAYGMKKRYTQGGRL